MNAAVWSKNSFHGRSDSSGGKWGVFMEGWRWGSGLSAFLVKFGLLRAEATAPRLKFGLRAPACTIFRKNSPGVSVHTRGQNLVFTLGWRVRTSRRRAIGWEVVSDMRAVLFRSGSAGRKDLATTFYRGFDNHIFHQSSPSGQGIIAL